MTSAQAKQGRHSLEELKAQSAFALTVPVLVAIVRQAPLTRERKVNVNWVRGKADEYVQGAMRDLGERERYINSTRSLGKMRREFPEAFEEEAARVEGAAAGDAGAPTRNLPQIGSRVTREEFDAWINELLEMKVWASHNGDHKFREALEVQFDPIAIERVLNTPLFFKPYDDSSLVPGSRVKGEFSLEWFRGYGPSYVNDLLTFDEVKLLTTVVFAPIARSVSVLLKAHALGETEPIGKFHWGNIDGVMAWQGGGSGISFYRLVGRADSDKPAKKKTVLSVRHDGYVELHDWGDSFPI